MNGEQLASHENKKACACVAFMFVCPSQQELLPLEENVCSTALYEGERGGTSRERRSERGKVREEE